MEWLAFSAGSTNWSQGDGRSNGRLCTKLLVILLCTVLIMAVGCRSAKASLEELRMVNGFPLVLGGKAASVYIDPNGADYDGLSLVAKSFAEDVRLVTGVVPEIVTESKMLTDTAVIFGSIGNNEIIDSLIADGVIDVSDIKGKWECYKIQVVKEPAEGIEQAVVVVGSDKRGTIYGIYHISELIGVSPWVYWADVPPVKREQLVLSEDILSVTSKEPSVKYRGIFLNNEWPSLGSWVNNTFGGFNEGFYSKVFELILRLKGNYLWPAMWSASFSTDGVTKPTANAELADAYGIVMGTSHHEPLFRAGVEWQRVYRNYGPSNLWDFARNREAITKFWEDGVKRNKDFENLITLGMRGEADSALPGSDEYNIRLLKDIIVTQKEILRKYGLEDAPKVLTLYKEVERFWYGTDTTEGLRDWDELDDVTIILCDDNFGNTRTLPTEEERDRKAGWGMYYHFDYHGAPRSYEWVNTVPLEKIWEQMSMAYDYGVREVWVVNVGDLKPMELPISYFLDLAYDFETWGTNGINKTQEYTKRWVEQQYGAVVDAQIIDGIAKVLSDYVRLNGKRKPEITYSNTYSFTNFNEAQRVLHEAIRLEEEAQKYYDLIPEAYKDSYYQLVYYPAVASANVTKMQIFAGLNALYYDRKSVLANTYAALTQECIDKDRVLQSTYNNIISNGKWRGMMSSPHVGYTKWNSDGWTYPQVRYLDVGEDYRMIVDVEGTQQAYVSGTARLPEFTNIGRECYGITISNGGNSKFDYTVETSANWIKVSKTSGTVYTGENIFVSIDWDLLMEAAGAPSESNGVITIRCGHDRVDVNVTARVIDIEGLPEMTFVETHDVVSIEAEHTADRVAKSGVEWKVIENYGRSLSSMKMFPTTVSFNNVEEAPYLEYRFYIDEDGEYQLTTYTAPTNNLSVDSRLRYAVSFDGADPVIADALPVGFKAGDIFNAAWSNAVMENVHKTTTVHTLTKGVHTLRFYGLDAGLVLQKLVLSKGDLAPSYFGPEESFYVGKIVKQQEGVRYEVATRYTVPGIIYANDLEKKEAVMQTACGRVSYDLPVIVAKEGEYNLTLTGESYGTSEVALKEGPRTLAILAWDAGIEKVQTARPINLSKGRHDLTLEVTLGNVIIDEITFVYNDGQATYPVTITASSIATGKDASNVYDGRRATSWRPAADDTAPWIEFAFAREYYFDRFVLKGVVDNVLGYEVQISSSGGDWETVYRGTTIATDKDVYIQGTRAYKGDRIRIVFTQLNGEIEISEMDVYPYINWALEDGMAEISVTKPGDRDLRTIIDGDRINPGWITQNTARESVTLTFGEARTIDTVTVVGVQESVWRGGEGTIPDADMTSAYVQRQYTVHYLDERGRWVQVTDYVTQPDGKETEPLRKVLNKISLGRPITTRAIRVDIGTSYWIRLIELEAVESHKFRVF